MSRQVRALGISGSPRRGGNSDILLAEFLKGAESRGAATKTLVLNNLKIAPCQHCDACLKEGICRIKDDMQGVYEELAAADVVVLAAPMHFMGLSAQTKLMVDRCQSLWAKKYVLKVPPLGSPPGEKRGFFIAVGGMTYSYLFQGAITVVKALFTCLDIVYTGDLFFKGIDRKGEIRENPDALKQVYEAGRKIVADFTG
jgi:multimeric flavodoxin WrbA